MPLPTPSRRPLVYVVLLAVLVAVGVGLYFYFRADLPDRNSERYKNYVPAFQVGVAALDLGAPPAKPGPNEDEANAIRDLARVKLTEAIATIKDEPAAWANRGLYFLRNNQLKEAAADLQQAEQLKPDSPEIQRLLGLLDTKRGKFSEAVGHYRQALKKDPKDLLALYGLVKALDKENGEGSDQEILNLLDSGLEVQPNNLRLLNDKGLIAVRLGNQKVLAEVVEAYKRLAPGWSGIGANGAQRNLAELESQARGTLRREDAEAILNTLGSNLSAEFSYTRDLREVGKNDAKEGEPVQQFLRLAKMQAVPSPADTDLEFVAASPTGQVAEAVARSRWNVVLPVWLTQDAEPVLFVADGREVRRAVGDAPALPFPGGEKPVAPTAHGVLAFDWNNDFRTDLLLAGAGGLRFFKQGEDGQFTDVTAKTNLDPETLTGDYFGAWAADIEMDGDLDIILAPRAGPPLVLRNNREGTFKVIKPFAGVESVRAFAWVDLDNDGAPEAVFLDAQGRLHIYTNERLGQFRERELPQGLGKYLALAVADVTDDGVFDLLALRDDGVVQWLSDKDKGKSWEVGELARWPAFPAGQEPGAFRLLTADLDNNGGIDLIATGPAGTQVWLSDEHGKFAPQGDPLAETVFAILDLNQDHRLDLLALSDGGQAVQRVNRGKKNYHWQVIRTHTPDRRKVDVKPDQRVNSFGIGSDIEIRSGLLVQKQPIAAPVVHFGLGEQPSTAVARFQWTNGTTQAEFDLPGDQAVSVEQRLTGSCPFLFTDDGHDMQFVADFMWGTPLGMYINAQAKGGFAQTEERVKIRGDQLVPRDGSYDVRVTADLWETHFFDHLSLIVVDHPADTEVFVDERFSIKPSPPAVHVTAPPRPIARALDDRGQDVTDIVRVIDGRYLDTFGRGKFQGVTRDHYVEADLGDDAPTEGPVWLLASGWIHPTDSSLNVAIEQGNHDRPRSLVLEVPDGHGGWKTGRDDIGFPAGKNKTILIRLDGIAGNPGVARRFRLRTNMEIYWDALRYARGLDAGLARQQRLDPEVADLRFRGMSLMTAADPSSPELPKYDRLRSQTQCWRDLIGYYTRYGDVRELLARTDDRYVIMNAGDEIAMKFRAPEGPPMGWKRDFVWVSDGWTKDGNLNTRFSKTVLPLPYHDLENYDQPPGRLEDDPVYRKFPEDWQKYHTRYVTPAVFEQGLRNFRRPDSR
jgi:tetratricopeptide (TPR) repeat protein